LNDPSVELVATTATEATISTIAAPVTTASAAITTAIEAARSSPAATTAAAATALKAAAAAAATTAARTASFTGACFVHRQRTAFNVLAVEPAHRFLRSSVSRHGYKGETTRLIRELVENDLNFSDVTDLAEQVLQFAFCHRES
jgi:hypothetical protein